MGRAEKNIHFACCDGSPYIWRVDFIDYQDCIGFEFKHNCCRFMLHSTHVLLKLSNGTEILFPCNKIMKRKTFANSSGVVGIEEYDKEGLDLD